MDLDPSFLAAVTGEANEWGGHLGITLVGHVSRTWSEDKRTLFDLLEHLQGFDPSLFVAIHGAFGFDLMVTKLCQDMQIEVRSDAQHNEVSRKDRFGYQTVHAPDLYAGTVAVVVLTRRKHSQEVYEIDPYVLDSAVQGGHPVFAFNEEGILWPWP